jgi:hypothetical protein
MALPSEPIIFTKAISCIVGPNDDVILPPGATKGDWEVELGVVMGLPTRGQAPNVTCLVLTLERSAMLTWSKTLRAGARRRGHS